MKKLSKLFRRKKEIRVEKTIAEIRQKLEEQRENFLQNSKIGKEIVEMEEIEKRLEAIQNLGGMIGAETLREYKGLQERKTKLQEEIDYILWFETHEIKIREFMDSLTSFLMKPFNKTMTFKCTPNAEYVIINNKKEILNRDYLIKFLQKYGYTIEREIQGEETKVIKITYERSF